MNFLHQDGIRKRIPLFVFLFFYLLFTFATYRDYGATWDEQDTYQGGAELYNYIIHGVQPPYLDPEHSYPYTFLLSFLTSKMDFEFFHLLNLLFAVFLFWAVFEMLLAQYGKPWFALAGPVFLFLTLPFSGSIPANPKDIPFAIFYFLSLAAIYLFEEKIPEFKVRWAILGILFALTISSRIVGFTLFPILILFDGYVYGSQDKKRGSKGIEKWFRKKASDWLGVLVVSQILSMVLWPYMGENYFKHLVNVFWLSAHFPPKFAFLFMGGMADSLTYPWYYLPLWIGITMPLFILAFFIYSFFILRTAKTHKLHVLLAGTFLLNLGLYLWLHPAIYDGLRHFLFLLPVLSTLSTISFIELIKDSCRRNTKGIPKVKRKIGKTEVFSKSNIFLRGFAMKVVLLLALFNLGMTVTQMVRLHPYEYVYFNELVGGFKGAYGKYETDYWVASMKEAVQWLKANKTKDSGKILKIYAQGKPFQSQIYFSPNMAWVASPKKADYSIVMTRAGIKPDPEDQNKIIHRVEREGAPLSFILKLR